DLCTLSLILSRFLLISLRTTIISPLSLHDALPIYQGAHLFRSLGLKAGDHIALLMENRLAFMEICWAAQRSGLYYTAISRYLTRSEEHTSELQSRENLVCRLLLEKKNQLHKIHRTN